MLHISKDLLDDLSLTRRAELMKNVVIGLLALPLLAGIAAANQPTVLDDAQMDGMTAGDVMVKIQTPTQSAFVNSQKTEARAPSFSVSFEPTQSDSPQLSISIQHAPPPFPAIMPPGIASAPLMSLIMPP